MLTIDRCVVYCLDEKNHRSELKKTALYEAPPTVSAASSDTINVTATLNVAEYQKMIRRIVHTDDDAIEAESATHYANFAREFENAKGSLGICDGQNRWKRLKRRDGQNWKSTILRTNPN